jgi:O-antigen ligase
MMPLLRQSPARRVSIATGAERGWAADALDTVQHWALIALLAWAPLPFGSARPWAWSLLGTVAAVLLLIAGFRELLSPASTAPLVQLRLPMLLALLLMGWVLLQTLPQSLAGWHHPLWDQAAKALRSTVVPSIAVDREASLVYLFRLLTYAAVFFLAWQVGQRPERARRMMHAVLGIAVLYSLYGFTQYASPDPKILWFRKWFYLDDLTATFVNHNSFATFAGLALIAGLVPIVQLLARSTDARSRTTLVVSVVENLLSRGKWALGGCFVTASALLLSHSRGGVMATLCGVLVFLVLAMTAPSLSSDWRRPFAWLSGAGALAVLALAGTTLIQRVAESSVETDSRWQVFASTLSAVRDNFFLGTGLGSFRYIFPMYQPTQFHYVADFAHNDYLQNMLELGVPAALLLFALVGILVWECFKGVRRRRRDAIYPCAAVAASILVAVHSFVDFSLQIPAVTVTYAALLGVGVAQSVSSEIRERGRL